MTQWDTFQVKVADFFLWASSASSTSLRDTMGIILAIDRLTRFYIQDYEQDWELVLKPLGVVIAVFYVLLLLASWLLRKRLLNRLASHLSSILEKEDSIRWRSIMRKPNVADREEALRALVSRYDLLTTDKVVGQMAQCKRKEN